MVPWVRRWNLSGDETTTMWKDRHQKYINYLAIVHGKVKNEAMVLHHRDEVRGGPTNAERGAQKTV